MRTRAPGYGRWKIFACTNVHQSIYFDAKISPMSTWEEYAIQGILLCLTPWLRGNGQWFRGVDVMNICHVIVTPSADAERLSPWGSR
jgi:hypothetical protein